MLWFLSLIVVCVATLVFRDRIVAKLREGWAWFVGLFLPRSN